MNQLVLTLFSKNKGKKKKKQKAKNKKKKKKKKKNIYSSRDVLTKNGQEPILFKRRTKIIRKCVKVIRVV